MPSRTLLFILCMLLSLGLGVPSSGAAEIPDTPVGQQLRWILDAIAGRSDQDATSRFHPEFVKVLPDALPEPKATSVILGLRENFFGGEEAQLVTIRDGATPTELVAELEAPATGGAYLLHLAVDDERGLIAGLLITHNTARPLVGLASWEEVERALADLPGDISVLVAKAEPDAPSPLRPVLAMHPERRLGIGSAFKLWVLGGLAELVRDGEAAWDELLPLNPDLKTMPYGALRMEAINEGLGDTASFPLSRYADLMISISDNPASDHLIRRVGQERIIEFMERTHADPDLNSPFLTTGEFFKLKRGAPQEVLDRYCAATTPEERRAVLDSEEFTSAEISLPLAVRWPKDGPIAIDKVEWFASAAELLATMLELRRLEQLEGMEALAKSLRINDGINLDDDIWPSVAYKGGSEPGVLNLTFLAEHRDGGLWGVSLGWNNSEAVLDEERLLKIAIAIFALLDAGERPENAPMESGE